MHVCGGSPGHLGSPRYLAASYMASLVPVVLSHAGRIILANPELPGIEVTEDPALTPADFGGGITPFTCPRGFPVQLRPPAHLLAHPGAWAVCSRDGWCSPCNPTDIFSLPCLYTCSPHAGSLRAVNIPESSAALSRARLALLSRRSAPRPGQQHYAHRGWLKALGGEGPAGACPSAAQPPQPLAYSSPFLSPQAWPPSCTPQLDGDGPPSSGGRSGLCAGRSALPVWRDSKSSSAPLAAPGGSPEKAAGPEPA